MSEVKVPKPKAYERAGFMTENAYRTAVRQSKAWSRTHSKLKTSTWSDKFTPEQKGAYFRAYVSKATGLSAYWGRKHKKGERNGGGSRELRKFLVEITGYYTPDEWDEKYVAL